MNTVMLACECAAWYAGKGMTLLDAMHALHEKYGWYRSGLITQAFEGQDGMRTTETLMASLLREPPQEIAGRSVTGITDYLAGDTGLPSADVLEFRLAGEGKLIVRPSGTEPKLKIYLSARGGSAAAAEAALTALTQAAGALMERR